MRTALLMVVCLLAVACDEDPARKVKVAPRPTTQPVSSTPAPVAATPSPAPATKSKAAPAPHAPKSAPPLSGWLADFCPIPAEDSSGPSAFDVQGPCAFQHLGTASCQAIGDDFLVAVTRKAKQGTLVAFINVEHYHGPGEYDGAQLFVAVQNGTIIHRWSSDTVNTVVGAGEAFITLPKTLLELEPTLKDCTTLIGPASAYQYQCAGLDNSKALQKIDEYATGKLACAAQH